MSDLDLQALLQDELMKLMYRKRAIELGAFGVSAGQGDARTQAAIDPEPVGPVASRMGRMPPTTVRGLGNGSSAEPAPPPAHDPLHVRRGLPSPLPGYEETEPGKLSSLKDLAVEDVARLRRQQGTPEGDFTAFRPVERGGSAREASTRLELPETTVETIPIAKKWTPTNTGTNGEDVIEPNNEGVLSGAWRTLKGIFTDPNFGTLNGAFGEDPPQTDGLPAPESPSAPPPRGPVPSPAVPKAKGVVQKMQQRGAPLGTARRGAVVPSGPGAPVAAGETAGRKPLPVRAAEALVTGSAPPAVSATPSEEDQIKAATDARDKANFFAAMATQGGHIADIVSGTEGPDLGAGIRAAAGNKLKDTLDRYGRKRDEEDRQLDLEGRRLDLEGKKMTAQQKKDYNDGASAVSKRRRAWLIAQYPDLAKKFSPEDFGSLSAADIDAIMGEAALPKGAVTGGARGLKPSEANSIIKRIPPHFLSTYNALDRLRTTAKAIGGWGNAAVGGLKGMLPGMALSKEQQALRQELAAVVGEFLKAGGGKSITSNEEKIIIGRIGADPSGVSLTPEMIERGLDIIDRSLNSDFRQSMTLVPPEVRKQIADDMRLDPAWVDQNTTRPTGEAGQAPTKPKTKKMRNPKTGEVIEVQVP